MSSARRMFGGIMRSVTTSSRRPIASRGFCGRRVALAAALLTGLLACSGGADQPVDEAGAEPARSDAEEPAAAVPDAAAQGVEEALALGIGGAGIAVDPGTLACADIPELAPGAEVDCEFARDGQAVGLVAAVLAVDGTAIEVDIRTEARPVAADVLAAAVSTRASQQLGGIEVTATCASDLAPMVDSSATCTVASDGQERAFQIVVDTVDGGFISWRMEAT